VRLDQPVAYVMGLNRNNERGDERKGGDGRAEDRSTQTCRGCNSLMNGWEDNAADLLLTCLLRPPTKVEHNDNRTEDKSMYPVPIRSLVLTS
jgi:hypothetical protein